VRDVSKVNIRVIPLIDCFDSSSSLKVRLIINYRTCWFW